MRIQGQLSITIAITLLALSILATPAHAIIIDGSRFGGCVIATDKGALQDADCDKAPDPFDNCPLTPNLDQIDRDHNGIGDACDLIIEEIRIEPETPQQGRSMVVHVALLNNRAYPMHNMVVKAEVPALGVAASEDVPVIGPGERLRKELIMRVPDCAPAKFTDVAVMAEYPFSPGQKEVFSQVVKVPVVSGGTCSQETGSDKTVVTIMEVQDVDPIQGALYPFTIKNMQSESKAYVLSVTGTEQWGAAEVHPGTVIIVPGGESREGAIQVWAQPGVVGRRSFTFTVQAKDDTKQIVLLATVPQQAGSGPAQGQAILWAILIFVLIALVIAGAIIAVRKQKRK
jgi:hypothetical protein